MKRYQVGKVKLNAKDHGQYCHVVKIYNKRLINVLITLGNGAEDFEL